jgi:ATP/maltotriose-dependent transcriptional regulator MalT
VESTGELERGRAAYKARAWVDAADALRAADVASALTASDLELLATTIYMLGDEEDHLAVLERAHQARLDEGEPRRAALDAFWIGVQLVRRGELGRGGGWLGRAQRLVADEDCAERAYLRVPDMFRLEAEGDFAGAAALAAEAADAGRRHGDADLTVLGGHSQGIFLVAEGRVAEGLALLDEAMLNVTSGEVSPITSGIVYCGAIVGCQTAFDPRRAQEWTTALHEWCSQQPDLVAFTGACHVHRAENMRLRGEWDAAFAELERAEQRALRGGNARVAAHAVYHRGEIQRLRGELTAAEETFRDASRRGWEPQPGLALLRLQQGDGAAARAAISRVLGETTDPARRAGLLPACVEIMLAGGDLDAARAAQGELEQIAAERPSDMLAAMLAHTRGAVALAAGDAGGALTQLRRALDGWHDVGAPYEAARVRLLLAAACAALGDEDSAGLARDAARDACEQLGAALPQDRVRDAHGLTARELQVLRLVAAGATNKTIAAELVLSERTIDRHVSNILAKLRVASRSAATAYAYEHRLLTG